MLWEMTVQLTEAEASQFVQEVREGVWQSGATPGPRLNACETHLMSLLKAKTRSRILDVLGL